jgi:hypothetical protein
MRASKFVAAILVSLAGLLVLPERGLAQIYTVLQSFTMDAGTFQSMEHTPAAGGGRQDERFCIPPAPAQKRNPQARCDI